MQRKEFRFRGLPFAITILVTGAVADPSLADPAVPAQQSKCELRANEFAAHHPHADPLYTLKFGFFPFGDSTPPQVPSTYYDADSGITFYVESDGRHLAALDSHGSLLWVRNPFVDAGLCPYRSAHPYISSVGPTPDARTNVRIVNELDNEIGHGRKIKRPRAGTRFTRLSFNSSQFGYVNIANGDFYFMGQN